MLNNRKRRPTHPGEILREDVLPELGLTQGEFADLLQVSRRTVNEILGEKRPVTVDMAHRLARALGTSPDVWLTLQRDVDVWNALQENKEIYDRIKPLRKAA
jgi:addiction module HigA family antidote